MTKTELRNGVLFYISVKTHKFAVIGDVAIDEVVPDDFWVKTKEVMLAHFKEGRFALGLIEGIGMAGSSLKQYFPFQKDDINELPDDISFGK
jgi:uncharacterized membrane protein